MIPSNQAIPGCDTQISIAKSMMSELIELGLTKKDISKHSGISISTIRRILLSNCKKMSSHNFSKLFYFYCLRTLNKAE